uniref:Uncharacterized protein n=1 Tax=Panagrolaimus davidi TaxID=227884 RepID=A0A914Q333_9BILA
MDIEEGESSADNYIQGHSAKKSKTEPQMQDENVLNENIQNEFDDGQEPFDVKEEEMSEQIILQINTLNESYNAWSWTSNC